jgi:hypothetical protein
MEKQVKERGCIGNAMMHFCGYQNPEPNPQGIYMATQSKSLKQ